MKRYAYRERDYAFGQLMLTLRTSLGLTQAGLAERLGVSKRAVAEWEGGSSYPKAEHLQQLITLAVQLQVWEAGREEEEIRALWKAARQKVLLDEDWLADLLASARPVPLSPPAGTPAAPAFVEAVSLAARRLAGSPRREPLHRPRGGSGRALPVDPPGALPPGDARGHGRHRQEYAGFLPGQPPGSPVRGGALALGARRPRMRGPGRRLHHLLL